MHRKIIEIKKYDDLYQFYDANSNDVLTIHSFDMLVCKLAEALGESRQVIDLVHNARVLTSK